MQSRFVVGLPLRGAVIEANDLQSRRYLTATIRVKRSSVHDQYARDMAHSLRQRDLDSGLIRKSFRLPVDALFLPFA